MTHFYCYLSEKDENENEIPKITFKLFNGFCLASCPRFPFEFCDNRHRPFQQFTQKAYHFPRFAMERTCSRISLNSKYIIEHTHFAFAMISRWEDRKPWLEFELGFQIFYSPERINILFTRVGMTFFYDMHHEHANGLPLECCLQAHFRFCSLSSECRWQSHKALAHSVAAHFPTEEKQ